tara:strand:+ start:490 stop:1983 length:1494 start_codon:yes stop_codon:yes gene_type:complete
MANTTETATFNVKSNIGEVGKDAGSAAGEFALMGVSLNGVKKGFTAMAVTAKASFATIKAGMISTGVGALIVAIGSLVSYFTSTKRGADQLSLVFKAMGATVSVLTDRLSKVGEAISFVFSGEFRKAGNLLGEVFSNITDEIIKETTAMALLEKRTQALRDEDNKFMIQKAATRQEIERARLIAEDETKTAAERLKNLKKALELEAETTKQEIELAKERVAIQQEEMALSENLVEDEEKLAQLKVALIETETSSIKMRRRVVTEVNALENEIRAEQKTRSDAKLLEIAKLKKAEQELYDAQIAQANAFEDNVARLAAEEIETARQVEATKQQVRMAGLNNVSAGINLAKSFAGESKGIQSGLLIAESAAGIAKTIISTQVANTGALATPQAILTSGTSAIPVIAMNNISAGISIAANIAATAKGLSALGSGGAPSGTNPSGGGGAGGGSGTPAPQMMSGEFDISGGVEPEPVKAFVLTDEMTNSQNQLANIRRRATI